MSERVRRIQHVGAAAEGLDVDPAEQEIAEQRLGGGHQLVRQHVPGAHLEPALGNQSGDPRALIGTEAQVVLDEHGLAVEKETAKAGLDLEAVEQVVDGGNEPRREGGASDTIPDPSGYADQVDGQRGHGPASAADATERPAGDPKRRQRDQPEAFDHVALM